MNSIRCLLIALLSLAGACSNSGPATSSLITPSPAASYSISGSLIPASGGAGATVVLAGAANATTTVDDLGNYVFSGLPSGSFTVTPSSKTATFAPASQTVTIGDTSVSDVNFTATKQASVLFFDNFEGSSLSSDWTIISRHGEYTQNETECNIPQQVAVNNGLTITAAARSATCGDFNVDGSVRHAPSVWPYVTGDVQWTSRNFTYGTVEIRGKLPSKSTGLWPAFWLLGSNCQNTNPFTADVGYSTCPSLTSSSYAEIDMVECLLDNWCQLALATPSGFATCGFQADTNYHIFRLTWNSSKVSLDIDGQYSGCSFTSESQTIPSTPMFLIMQIQTGGAGGTPSNALLPATLAVDYVRVTQP